LILKLGQSAKAERMLRQVDDPKALDWRLALALGAALAARGKQQGPGLGARSPERA
jgi:Flp pilus assembly protein TadD